MGSEFSRLAILIVDDDPTMRSVIASALRSAGCTRIRQAANGEQALEVVRQTHLDLITCDHQMAPIDGLTFLRQLRELPAGATKPVIMLTANNRPEDAWAARELRVSAWLVKPITPQAVIKRIAAVLGINPGAPLPEDALAGLAEAYEKRLPAEIASLESIAARLPVRPEFFDTTLQDLVRRLHVVKGQAGTLGYGLLGAVAGAVHDVLREAERIPEVDLSFRPDLIRLVESAFKVLRLIVEKNVRGDAGAVGAKVLGDIAAFADPLRKRIVEAVEAAEAAERIRRDALAEQLAIAEREKLFAERRIRLHQDDARTPA